jgi:hypothetical protein
VNTNGEYNMSITDEATKAAFLVALNMEPLPLENPPVEILGIESVNNFLLVWHAGDAAVLLGGQAGGGAGEADDLGQLLFR